LGLAAADPEVVGIGRALEEGAGAMRGVGEAQPRLPDRLVVDLLERRLAVALEGGALVGREQGGHGCAQAGCFSSAAAASSRA
jgi:hypothetical protein